MERQEIPHRDDPPQLVAVFDEMALGRRIGGPTVMRAQLAHLVEMGSRYWIHLHVVPAGAGAYPGLNGAFVLATLAGALPHRQSVELIQKVAESWS